MLTVLLVIALAVEPASEKTLTLAFPGLNAVNLAKGEGELYAELIAQKFAAHDVRVMTARDLTAVLGLERQRQLLGCTENSCLIEMIAALGADGVLIGDLGKLGDEYALNLKILSTNNGQALAQHNTRAANAKDLAVEIDDSVRSMLRAFARSMNRLDVLSDAQSVPQSKQRFSRTWALAPATLGILAVGAGVTLQVLAANDYARLKSAPLLEPEARELRDKGRNLEIGANVALGVGGAAIATAVVMFIMGGERTVTPTVAVTASGASVGFVGVVP